MLTGSSSGRTCTRTAMSPARSPRNGLDASWPPFPPTPEGRPDAGAIEILGRQRKLAYERAAQQPDSRRSDLRRGGVTMRAAMFQGPGRIEVGDRPDPTVAAPTDAVVRVALACVCGSDLWYYRGESPHDVGPIGHEFIGVVSEVGAAVAGLAKGDFVVAPFTYNDGTCAHCLAGWPSNCANGGSFGNHGIDGGQS